jgi:hypothetical protein
MVVGQLKERSFHSVIRAQQESRIILTEAGLLSLLKQGQQGKASGWFDLTLKNDTVRDHRGQSNKK